MLHKALAFLQKIFIAVLKYHSVCQHDIDAIHQLDLYSIMKIYRCYAMFCNKLLFSLRAKVYITELPCVCLS